MLKVEGNMVIEELKINDSIVKLNKGYIEQIKLTHNMRIVKAKVFNYLNEFQSDFNGVIKFECERIIQEIPAVNGIAEITIDMPIGETIIVKTVNEQMNNGEVVING